MREQGAEHGKEGDMSKTAKDWILHSIKGL